MTSIRAPRDYSGGIIGLLHLRNHTSHVQTKRRIILSIAACLLIVSIWGPGSNFLTVGGSPAAALGHYSSQTNHGTKKELVPDRTIAQRQEEQHEMDPKSNAVPTTKEEENTAAPDEEATKHEPESKLECRASVMEFVINASDQKDECDGLRRAFVTACTNLDMAGQIFSAPPPQNNNNVKVINDPNLDYVNPTLVDPHTLNNLHRGRPDGGRRNKINALNFMQQTDGLSYEDGSKDDGHKIIRRLMTPAYPAAGTTPVLLQQSHSSNSNQEASNNRAISVSYATTPATPAHHSTLYSHAQSILDSPESIEARTCCASILNVFHEHCDRNEEIEYTDRSLFVIVSVIAVCSIVKSLLKHFEIHWLPEAAGCILVGGKYWCCYFCFKILILLLCTCKPHDLFHLFSCFLTSTTQFC